jgi:hypothetical protein
METVTETDSQDRVLAVVSTRGGILMDTETRQKLSKVRVQYLYTP